MIPVAAPSIGDEEVRAVASVLATAQLAQGEEVASFEREFSEAAVDGAHCVAVNSGTSALHLSLLAAGIGHGDEVIVPSFTFAATANAVSLTGAVPVFADIDQESFCLNPDAVRAAIGPKTVGVIPVHLYGHPASLNALTDICQRHGLALIEDCAQAHLAEVQGKPVGTWGLSGAFSFYPTKNMTCGEGGMVVTRDATLAQRVRLLRNQGQERRYENEIVGFNNRMTDVHAAIGRQQLRKLPEWTRRRQSNARHLNSNLLGVGIPFVAPTATHVYHQYTIRVLSGERDLFQARLADLGVGSGVYYPTPVHRLPSFGREVDLPVTEEATQQCLSLPIHPSLTPTDLEAISDAVNTIADCAA